MRSRKFVDRHITTGTSYCPSGTVRWPNGIVPYYIDDSFDWSDDNYNLILAGLKRFSKQVNGCIQFVPATDETDYVLVTSTSDGCNSYLGVQDSDYQPQELNLDQDGCMHISTVMHEFAHAVGLIHEQSRPDRDDYIFVDFDNIIDDSRWQDQFGKKYTADQIDTLGIAYDIYSVMQYPSFFHGYQIDEEIPIYVPVDPDVDARTVGFVAQLSDFDIKKIMKFYECPYVGRTVNIKLMNNTKYVYTANNGEIVAQASCSIQKFQIIANDDGTISLKSLKNKKYVSTDPSTFYLNANADNISGDAEKFVLYKNYVGNDIHLFYDYLESYSIKAKINSEFLTTDVENAAAGFYASNTGDKAHFSIIDIDLYD